MGTPEYMAPEQAYSADAVDARADIFSLGVMIFEMLAGRRPVGGDEPHQIATAYLTRNIAKLLDLAPYVPPELAAGVHRAMGRSRRIDSLRSRSCARRSSRSGSPLVHLSRSVALTSWSNPDEGFLSVVDGVMGVVDALSEKP